MTSWVWKAVKVIVALGCGVVVVFSPSEVDQLAAGQAAGRTAANFMLAFIACGLLTAAFCPSRYTKPRICGLRVAGLTAIMYGAFAIAVKHAIALPSGCFALGIGLLFIDRASAILVYSQEREDPR